MAKLLDQRGNADHRLDSLEIEKATVPELRRLMGELDGAAAYAQTGVPIPFASLYYERKAQGLQGAGGVIYEELERRHARMPGINGNGIPAEGRLDADYFAAFDRAANGGKG